jgi:hypothetical protein
MTYHHILAAAMLSLKRERTEGYILMASEEEKVAL